MELFAGLKVLLNYKETHLIIHCILQNQRGILNITHSKLLKRNYVVAFTRLIPHVAISSESEILLVLSLFASTNELQVAVCRHGFPCLQGKDHWITGPGKTLQFTSYSNNL